MNNEIERKTRRYNEYYFKDKKGFELMKVDKRYLVRDVLRLQQENKELHNKIDKAIEYIEDYGHGYDCTGDGYYCLDEDNQKELLEILKDSDVVE